MHNLSRTQITKHIQRLLTRWPTDAIRPSSVSVQTYLQSRLTPPAPETQSTSRWSQLFHKSSPPSQPSTATSSTQSSEEPLLSSQNVNALYSLLENRYQKKYPLPNSLRYPASQSDYFDKLLKEFEEAPQRNWLGRLGKKFGGILRFK
ncbi:hypothetical protein D8B26_001438 [Coccidioides posadasii str. Silveira]|uniref:Uncharacterized protein n=3 Tax=Coccidioides posadasii TaxID=199306 RepID=E9DJJ4_COCPS|nr:hypothetical protein CPC735_047090 [Coccidioides posadasii C735 delta SOWgp]EER23339.1 hypothetical protein CPC735_047090 [Coccidioides posadasii C735 delta SOWgp]EFW13447.1 conserved hypothetical protein [Coccidioides posadasii str. Silveira]KMM64673.1 hypothetical protein CPAG_01025 [Coccidioides posadasii RMSCC 3488]QVM06732.1 hypothetical protein D8B26_001438 [Coccidioides posadasii str. Silveira]|eukprot:XP_003065484.1 hypothetical protein CPC735_047090 [Coccidioides posadasii C735 delta SOWgp]